jgi:hypothetical protein
MGTGPSRHPCIKRHYFQKLERALKESFKKGPTEPLAWIFQVGLVEPYFRSKAALGDKSSVPGYGVIVFTCFLGYSWPTPKSIIF